MNCTDLKKIFPHSFIDYDGRRKAKVVVFGRFKASEVAQAIDNELELGESVSVNDLSYDGRYQVTRFILQASGNTTPFLPRLDVADLQVIRERQQEAVEEKVASKKDDFSSKWDSFLNL